MEEPLLLLGIQILGGLESIHNFSVFVMNYTRHLLRQQNDTIYQYCILRRLVLFLNIIALYTYSVIRRCKYGLVCLKI